MALTEAERKLLEELEATLTAQDPKLASKFSQPQRRVHPMPVVVGVVGLLVGLVGLVAGMILVWWISVVGFVFMLGSVFLMMSAWSRKPGEAKSVASPAPPNEDFLTRMEKRWRDRQEQ